jgi:putative redox protein
MRAICTWNQNQQFDTRSESGHHILMDADSAHSGGPSPMEAVLMALCACTSTDVISILQKKREPFTALTVSAVAERASEAPRVFNHIQLVYRVWGTVSEKAMKDAVNLSKNKYCSVSQMLDRTAKIEFVIEHAAGEADSGASENRLTHD